MNHTKGRRDSNTDLPIGSLYVKITLSDGDSSWQASFFFIIHFIIRQEKISEKDNPLGSRGHAPCLPEPSLQFHTTSLKMSNRWWSEKELHLYQDRTAYPVRFTGAAPGS